MAAENRRGHPEIKPDIPDKYQVIFSIFPDGILFTDLEGNFLENNQAACRLLEYTSGEYKKLDYKQIVYPDDLPLLQSFFRNHHEKTKTFQREMRLLKKNGEIVFADINVYIVENQYYLITAHDITPQRTLIAQLDRSAADIRESEKKFRNLFEGMTEAALLLSHEGTLYDEHRNYFILAANSAFEDLFMFSCKDLINKPADIFLGDMPDACFETLKKAIQTGTPSQCEAYFEKRDRYLHVRCFLTREKVAALIFMDITERRRHEDVLKTSEEQFRTMFMKNSAVMLIVDPENGKILNANEAAEQFYGYQPGQLLCKHIFHLNTLPAESVKTIMGEVLQNEDRYFQFTHRLASGQLRDVEIYATPMKWEGRTCIFTIIHDISEEKQHKRELIHAKALAEKASRSKSEFLANMSHEIRTPISGIIGMTQMLLSRIEGTPFFHDMELILHGAESLMDIVNDILDFSKIEANKLTLKKTDFQLQEIIGDVAATINSLCRNKDIVLNIQLSPDIPPVVRGDPGRIKQILLNLAGNAVKFTQRGSITIKVEKITGNGQPPLLRFCVEDTGCGIPRAKQEIVFNAFTQVDNSMSKTYQGTGLGLAISKQLSKLMGGNLWFRSIEGAGSTFYFEHPLINGTSKKTKVTDGQAVPATAEADVKLRILLVEDNPMNRIFLQYFLTNAGHTVFIARDGPEALELFSKETPDSILMDIQLPGMSGLDVTSEIRTMEAERGLKRTRIIALTAYAQTGDRERFLSAGMDDYISKPVKMPQLTEKLLHLSEEMQDDVAAAERRYPVKGDLNELSLYLQAMKNEEAQLETLVSLFLADIPDKLDALRSYAAARDRTMCGKTLHSLANYVSVFQLSDLTRFLRELERDITSGDITSGFEESCIPRCADAENRIRAVMHHIEKIV